MLKTEHKHLQCGGVKLFCKIHSRFKTAFCGACTLKHLHALLARVIIQGISLPPFLNHFSLSGPEQRYPRIPASHSTHSDGSLRSTERLWECRHAGLAGLQRPRSKQGRRQTLSGWTGSQTRYAICQNNNRFTAQFTWSLGCLLLCFQLTFCILGL